MYREIGSNYSGGIATVSKAAFELASGTRDGNGFNDFFLLLLLPLRFSFLSSFETAEGRGSSGNILSAGESELAREVFPRG